MSKIIFKVGDDISTDAIYPGRFMATVLPSETPQFAFADYPEFQNLVKKNEIQPGSIIVGGNNFGCGSSREQAVSTLKGYDLTIVANDFARIFFQNSINLGLKCVVCPGVEASLGDELDITEDTLTNKTTGKSYSVEPLPKARQAIVDAGGLIAYTKKRLLEKHKA
jgi:3-isopropylmalate/(R)-2-methylmalate dehydratase small subunit